MVSPNLIQMHEKEQAQFSYWLLLSSVNIKILKFDFIKLNMYFIKNKKLRVLKIEFVMLLQSNATFKVYI